MWWVLWTGAAGAVIAWTLLWSRSRRLAGKLAVLTGGDTGQGLLVARELARRGARVILAGPDRARGTQAADTLSRETGARVQYTHLDLASLASVRRFAADLQKSERRVDVLINNASVSQLDNTLTEDGIAVEMQINYFGPFLLTNLLMPLLRQSSQGRVLTASSVRHYLGVVNVDSLTNVAKDARAHKQVSCNSKLCNILFTKQLAKRLQNTRVTVNCFQPTEPTTLEVQETTILSRIILFLINHSGKVDMTAVYLATSPAVTKVSGKYFVDNEERSTSKMATDDSLAEKLWLHSERAVELNPVSSRD